MNRHKGKFILLLFVNLLFCQLCPCFALPDDKLQVMQLRADTIDINQHEFKGIYQGNVQLDQGSTHLRAVSALTVGDKNKPLVKAIAKGDEKEQAHVWTTLALDKPELHAYADTIYYDPEHHLIELVGHARIEQGKDSFWAPYIRIDTVQQQLTSKSSGTDRTTIIIHPEQRHEKINSASFEKIF